MRGQVLILAICLVGYLVIIRLNGWVLSRLTGTAMVGVYVFAIIWVLLRESARHEGLVVDFHSPVVLHA